VTMDKNEEQDSVHDDEEQDRVHDEVRTSVTLNENAELANKKSSDNLEVDNIESSDVGDVLRGLILRDTWCAVRELGQREVGGFGRHVGPVIFASKTGGSVELVRRLKLHSKLDGHTGCVNALHFNESGKPCHIVI